MSRLDPMEAFAELGRIDLADNDVEQVLGRVAELAKRTIGAAAEVSVTLVRSGRDRAPTTAACTGELALRLDERQYEQGFGPCLDASEAGAVLLIRDMATEDRWPKYAPHAVEAGVRSSLSIGLPVQQAVTGALNIYGREPDSFDEDTVALAQTFAGYAAVALANAQLYASTAALAGQMQSAMASRAVIEQAKGLLMGQLRCSPDEAFTTLTRMSQRANRKLRDLATEIVEAAQKGQDDLPGGPAPRP
ncbi:MAG TPA: GAF and ANTAR domain-containing protein [Pseudonocardiaceae bacterium]